MLPLVLPLPLRERAGGEEVLVRDGLTLSFQLAPSCHSSLFPLVIPDVINRESNAGVRGARGSQRSPNLLRSLHHDRRKRPWIPA